tara:strand:- start:488 stop:1270 length:783 start_codon:yes stop_codon:yes gene_type:complete
MTKKTKELPVKKVAKKRGRKRKSKRYFTTITQMAILAYRQLPDDSPKREKIYKRFINEPMNKLVENTINNSTKGYHDHILQKVGFEELSQMTLIHNISKFKNYNPDKGIAFSYFNVIGRNFIINENRVAYKELKARADISCLDSERLITNEVYMDEFKTDLAEFTTLFVEYWDDNLIFHFHKHRDIKIAQVIIDFFRNCEHIEEYYKRNLYVIIREKTRIEKTQHITTVVTYIKKLHEKMFKVYRRTGKLIDDSEFEFGV